MGGQSRGARRARPHVARPTLALLGVGLALVACGSNAAGATRSHVRVSPAPASVAPTEVITLVERGASRYALYVAEQTPEVVNAARELQRLIERATSVRLPIVDEPTDHTVAVGAKAVARVAPELSGELASEEVRVVASAKGLLVWGDDQRGSAGSANAVATFAERVLGVRWLMPGELGEDIPRTDTVAIAPLDLRERPAFAGRKLTQVDDSRPEVAAWKAHQRLGGTVTWSHGHAWDEHVPLAEVAAHPELRARKERALALEQLDHRHAKFCTTHEALVEVFVQGIEGWFARHPDERTVSISPTDGEGWCDCDACQSLDDTDLDPRFPDYGGYHVSRTRRVLAFYDEVARRVAVRFPDRLVCGYVYASYLYPPRAPAPLASNLRLVVAPRPNYAFTLFREDRRRDFAAMMTAWGELSRERGYYDLPTWMRNPVGAPLPVAATVLQFALETALRTGTVYVYLYGQSSWGAGALHNYLAARLLWDPTIDTRAEELAWLARAYGPGYGHVLAVLDDVEAAFSAYMESHPGFYTDLTPDLVQAVYLPRLAAIASGLQAATQASETDGQRARLALFIADVEHLTAEIARAGWLEDDLAPSTDGAPEGPPPLLWAPEPREARVPRSRSLDVRLDGTPAEAAWSNAKELGPLRFVGSRRRDRDGSLLAQADAQTLWLGWTFPVRSRRERDRDFFDVHIAPRADRRKLFTVHVQPSGAARVSFEGKPLGARRLRVRTRRTGTAWSGELGIPFAMLGADAPPADGWLANFAHGSRSTWSSVQLSPSEPAHLGRLGFAPQAN